MANRNRKLKRLEKEKKAELARLNVVVDDTLNAVETKRELHTRRNESLTDNAARHLCRNGMAITPAIFASIHAQKSVDEEFVRDIEKLKLKVQEHAG